MIRLRFLCFKHYLTWDKMVLVECTWNLAPLTHCERILSWVIEHLVNKLWQVTWLQWNRPKGDVHPSLRYLTNRCYFTTCLTPSICISCKWQKKSFGLLILSRITHLLPFLTGPVWRTCVNVQCIKIATVSPSGPTAEPVSERESLWIGNLSITAWVSTRLVTGQSPLRTLR